MADFGQNVLASSVALLLSLIHIYSCVETAGARDVELAIEALAAFYGADIRIDGAEGVELA